MRKWFVPVLVAVGIAAGAAHASGVNACGLVSARQAAGLGVTASCKGTTRPGASGVVSFGNWGTPGAGNAALALTVTTFTDTSGVAWQVSMKLLKVLPGTAKKVNGIGSVAYESGGDGGRLASMHFVKGKRVVAFSWYSKKPQTSLKAFNAVAKSIAAQI